MNDETGGTGTETTTACFKCCLCTRRHRLRKTRRDIRCRPEFRRNTFRLPCRSNESIHSNVLPV